MTIGNMVLERLKGPISCKEHTLPRNKASTRAKGWIRENTRIGLVLEVMVCYHQGCYWIEIRIDSLPGDGSHSKVRFRNRVNKYMKAMSDILPNPKNHRWSTDRETCSKIETESNVIDVAVFWVEDEDRHINS